ncbi:hypothetical protein JD844_015082 [Phrynosoma platyrhinos]|uniref:Uncharacterized protein n=1 Tax=Phrynosoma platyrhinos TaxID=52577 RepID=A0ABQ7T7U6_PHRPL|nr:hypothetical protein JD844_015082 [Phrynosoma platyrhinos]
MKEISAEEGLVAEAYERKYSNWSRVHQIAKLYLFTPASGSFLAPLAMTDGAAKVIESLGIPKSLEEAYARLTSREPGRFWTSGQWMTERKGGSDVVFQAHSCLCFSIFPQISAEGRGVASIANMLTITRVHNAIHAAAVMRR